MLLRPSNIPKIVILVTKGTSANIIYNYLQDSCQIEAVIIEKPISKWKLLRSRAKKLGLTTVFGQILFQTLVQPVLYHLGKKRQAEIIRINKLSANEIPDKVIFKVASINLPETLAYIQKLKPDCIVLSGTRIASKKFLQAVGCPVLNIHAGITPAYRGVHGGYWALANNDAQNCGATIHLVDAGVDTGEVLHWVTIYPDAKADHFATYPLLQLAAALPFLLAGILSIIANDHQDKNVLSVASSNKQKSKQWYHPTIWQYLYSWWLKGVR